MTLVHMPAKSFVGSSDEQQWSNAEVAEAVRVLRNNIAAGSPDNIFLGWLDLATVRLSAGATEEDAKAVERFPRVHSESHSVCLTNPVTIHNQSALPVLWFFTPVSLLGAAEMPIEATFARRQVILALETIGAARRVRH